MSGVAVILDTETVVLSGGGSKVTVKAEGALIQTFTPKAEAVAITAPDLLPRYIGGGSSLEANRLVIEKVALGAVTKNQPVRLTGTNTVSTCGVSTLEEASVFGIALGDAPDGANVSILIFGYYRDASLVFPLNTRIYQDASGNLTTVATTIVGEFWTVVGRSYGDGAILVAPEEPVEVLS